MPTVRTAQPGDLDDLLALYQMLNPDDPRLDPATVEEQWKTMLADDSVQIVVVERDTDLVATCLLSITPNLTRGARPFALLENVVTHDAHRGEGLATQCVESALEIAARRDCYKVMLLTGSDRQWKHDFYEQCGFEKHSKTGFVCDLREE